MKTDVEVTLNNETSRKKKNQEMIVKCVKSGEPFPLILETQFSKKFVKDFRDVLSQVRLCKDLKVDPTPAAKDQLDGEVQKLLALYRDFKKNFIEKYNSKFVDAGVLYLNLSAKIKEFKEDKKAASSPADTLE